MLLNYQNHLTISMKQYMSVVCADNLTQTQWMWQWKDETGNWVSYSEENEKRLEHAYGKRSNGSCLLSINGLQLGSTSFKYTVWSRF